MTWIRACGADELADGEAIRIETSPPVAVFRSNGAHYALADHCSHGESPLSGGTTTGDTVECPWHLAQFCLRTGAALSPPAGGPVARFPVRIERGEVLVEIHNPGTPQPDPAPPSEG